MFVQVEINKSMFQLLHTLLILDSVSFGHEDYSVGCRGVPSFCEWALCLCYNVYAMNCVHGQATLIFPSVTSSCQFDLLILISIYLWWPWTLREYWIFALRQCAVVMWSMFQIIKFCLSLDFHRTVGSSPYASQCQTPKFQVGGILGPNVLAPQWTQIPHACTCMHLLGCNFSRLQCQMSYTCKHSSTTECS